MRYGGLNTVVFCILVLFCTGGPPLAASGDYDGNGYVDLVDYGFFVDCLAASAGPGGDAGTQECKDAFDNDEDSDVDARDFASFQLAQGLVPTTGDYDGDGYVDLVDYSSFEVCFTTSDGPGGDAGTPECKDAFDNNKDSDVDLEDYAAFQLVQGHTPIPLRDVLGNVLLAGSTEPYSPRQTCTGSCHAHDLDSPTGITGGYHFQEGRTDLDGSIIMGNDYFGDGRPWMQSPARYGRQTTADGLGVQLAPKDNTAESQIDHTTFAWVRDCGGCHAGGGPGEFDRAGERLYGYYEDTERFEFGYERLGLTAGDVVLDGDYSNMDMVTGDLSPAPWDTTGVSEPDCLLCHRADRTIDGGVDMNHTWRNETLLAGDALEDGSGAPVPAFLAASTAGQGWFSEPAVAEGLTALQIDYAQGLSEGSLITNLASELNLLTSSMTGTPYDSSCWACHGPEANEANIGMKWFDDRDVHYRKFNNLDDEDPNNDVRPERSRVCTHCHAGNLSHNISKGDSLQMHYRDELDFVGGKTCRSCHLTIFSNGMPNPDKDPDAPDVPGDGMVQAHYIGFYEGETAGMMLKMSCQACHAPYALGEAYVFCDYTVSPGYCGSTADYYSADFLDPTNPDKSAWPFGLQFKTDSDGLERLFPVNAWVGMFWGDWDQNGTPEDYSDDVVVPIIQWRIKQLTGDAPLPILEDDNGDGYVEVNRPEEILAYIQLLKGDDDYGEQVAARPVLVKGKRLWYEDSGSATNISSIDHTTAGFVVPIETYSYLYQGGHNVLPAEESLGAGLYPGDCNACHEGGGPSAVFDRLILIDPFDEDGNPVYETVRDMTGVNPG